MTQIFHYICKILSDVHIRWGDALARLVATGIDERGDIVGKSVVDAWFSDILKLRTLLCRIKKPCNNDTHGYVTSMPFWYFSAEKHIKGVSVTYQRGGSLLVSIWRVSSKTSECEASDNGLHAFGTRSSFVYVFHHKRTVWKGAIGQWKVCYT